MDWRSHDEGMAYTPTFRPVEPPPREETAPRLGRDAHHGVGDIRGDSMLDAGVEMLLSQGDQQQATSSSSLSGSVASSVGAMGMADGGMDSTTRPRGAKKRKSSSPVSQTNRLGKNPPNAATVGEEESGQGEEQEAPPFQPLTGLWCARESDTPPYTSAMEPSEPLPHTSSSHHPAIETLTDRVARLPRLKVRLSRVNIAAGGTDSSGNVTPEPRATPTERSLERAERSLERAERSHERPEKPERPEKLSSLPPRRGPVPSQMQESVPGMPYKIRSQASTDYLVVSWANNRYICPHPACQWYSEAARYPSNTTCEGPAKRPENQLTSVLYHWYLSHMAPGYVVPFHCPGKSPRGKGLCEFITADESFLREHILHCDGTDEEKDFEVKRQQAYIEKQIGPFYEPSQSLILPSDEPEEDEKDLYAMKLSQTIAEVENANCPPFNSQSLTEEVPAQPSDNLASYIPTSFSRENGDTLNFKKSKNKAGPASKKLRQDDAIPVAEPAPSSENFVDADYDDSLDEAHILPKKRGRGKKRKILPTDNTQLDTDNFVNVAASSSFTDGTPTKGNDDDLFPSSPIKRAGPAMSAESLFDSMATTSSTKTVTDSGSKQDIGANDAASESSHTSRKASHEREVPDSAIVSPTEASSETAPMDMQGQSVPEKPTKQSGKGKGKGRGRGRKKAPALIEEPLIVPETAQLLYDSVADSSSTKTVGVNNVADSAQTSRNTSLDRETIGSTNESQTETSDTAVMDMQGVIEKQRKQSKGKGKGRGRGRKKAQLAVEEPVVGLLPESSLVENQAATDQAEKDPQETPSALANLPPQTTSTTASSVLAEQIFEDVSVPSETDAPARLDDLDVGDKNSLLPMTEPAAPVNVTTPVPEVTAPVNVTTPVPEATAPQEENQQVTEQQSPTKKRGRGRSRKSQNDLEVEAPVSIDESQGLQRNLQSAPNDTANGRSTTSDQNIFEDDVHQAAASTNIEDTEDVEPPAKPKKGSKKKASQVKKKYPSRDRSKQSTEVSTTEAAEQDLTPTEAAPKDGTAEVASIPNAVEPAEDPEPVAESAAPSARGRRKRDVSVTHAEGTEPEQASVDAPDPSPRGKRKRAAPKSYAEQSEDEASVLNDSFTESVPAAAPEPAPAAAPEPAPVSVSASAANTEEDDDDLIITELHVPKHGKRRSGRDRSKPTVQPARSSSRTKVLLTNLPPDQINSKPHSPRKRGSVVGVEQPEDSTRTEPVTEVMPGTEPVVTEPSGTEPSGTEPVVAEPSGTEPSIAEPSGTEPVVAEPSVVEPSITEASGTEPSAGQLQKRTPKSRTPRKRSAASALDEPSTEPGNDTVVDHAIDQAIAQPLLEEVQPSEGAAPSTEAVEDAEVLNDSSAVTEELVSPATKRGRKGKKGGRRKGSPVKRVQAEVATTEVIHVSGGPLSPLHVPDSAEDTVDTITSTLPETVAETAVVTPVEEAVPNNDKSAENTEDNTMDSSTQEVSNEVASPPTTKTPPKRGKKGGKRKGKGGRPPKSVSTAEAIINTSVSSEPEQNLVPEAPVGTEVQPTEPSAEESTTPTRAAGSSLVPTEEDPPAPPHSSRAKAQKKPTPKRPIRSARQSATVEESPTRQSGKTRRSTRGHSLDSTVGSQEEPIDIDAMDEDIHEAPFEEEASAVITPSAIASSEEIAPAPPKAKATPKGRKGKKGRKGGRISKVQPAEEPMDKVVVDELTFAKYKEAKETIESLLSQYSTSLSTALSNCTDNSSKDDLTAQGAIMLETVLLCRNSINERLPDLCKLAGKTEAELALGDGGTGEDGLLKQQLEEANQKLAQFEKDQAESDTKICSLSQQLEDMKRKLAVTTGIQTSVKSMVAPPSSSSIQSSLLSFHLPPSTWSGDAVVSIPEPSPSPAKRRKTRGNTETTTSESLSPLPITAPMPSLSRTPPNASTSSSSGLSSSLLGSPFATNFRADDILGQFLRPKQMVGVFDESQIDHAMSGVRDLVRMLASVQPIDQIPADVLAQMKSP